MKVYAEHHKVQEFLKEQQLQGIDIVDDSQTANYLITGRYDRSKYHADLKGIIIPYTGHNNVDLDAMREQDLMLFITPTRSRWVAEKAVTLTLALLGRTIPYHEQLKIGNWSERNSAKRIPWTSIQDLSVGLFGYGRIGTYIHQFLRGFGCDFYTIDRGKVYPPEVKTVKNLTNLIQLSDIIIISTPLNHTTEGCFDKTKLSSMKHKYLINVGRGKIVEEEALYDVLTTGRLRGYASDVWYNYPKGKESQLPSNYPLHELDNVVMSNHSGGFTEHTNEEVNRDLIATLHKLLQEDYADQLDLTSLI